MALIKKCTETSLMSLVVIKRPRFGAGGIIDQGVIHYDTWLRKHSQYAFTRLSAKMFEIKSTRKLEQVISTGVHSKQHKEKRGK